MARLLEKTRVCENQHWYGAETLYCEQWENCVEDEFQFHLGCTEYQNTGRRCDVFKVRFVQADSFIALLQIDRQIGQNLLPGVLLKRAIYERNKKT